jgi:hypothetical protein
MQAFVKFSVAGSLLLCSACTTPGGGPAGIRMLDRDQHIGGAISLDGTPNGLCFSNVAFAHALISGRRPAPPGLPGACTDLLKQLEATPAFDAKSSRDNIAAAMMTVSNDRCMQYVQFLQMYHGNVNSIFGIGSQIASLIGSLTQGGTANAFAGIGGTIQGAGNTLNKNTFQDKALELIAAGFTKRRNRLGKEIQIKLAKPAAEYGVGQAVSDVIDYHSACSISAGFQELASGVAETPSSAPSPPIAPAPTRQSAR